MTNDYHLDFVGQVPSLKDRAYSSIKNAILTLNVKPGTALVETDLAREMGVSKTPVRDALLALEQEGFVIRVPFKGTYVTQISQTDLVEIFQLRAVLEGLAAHQATRLLSQKELDEIDYNLAGSEAALAQGDVALCSELGQTVHRAIIDKSENCRLVAITRNLDDHLRRFRAMSDRLSGRLDKSIREHRQILAALRQQDPEAAERAMRAHLFSVLEDLQASQG
jgi:DNA-binding GntR family transcriptional regulator